MVTQVYTYLIVASPHSDFFTCFLTAIHYLALNLIPSTQFLLT